MAVIWSWAWIIPVGAILVLVAFLLISRRLQAKNSVLQARLDEQERRVRELQDAVSTLEEHKRILETMLNDMDEGVAVADATGKFLIFNPAGRRIIVLRTRQRHWH